MILLKNGSPPFLGMSRGKWAHHHVVGGTGVESVGATNSSKENQLI